MAQVYLVRHRELQSVHALKVLSFHGRKNRERLLQEGRLQSGFRHPNVVPVTDVIEIYQMPALVMDYVPGPDLRMLFQHCKLTDVQVDELGRGLLRGALAAHQHGLVHRDLKPSNILIDIRDEQLIPRIADFGLAKTQFQSSENR